ncbi:MAG: 1-acyl-sn-glycerol-3-phosphate acyltransferase [Treponema sp.]|jgi:glycerol-3-phosphate O-acyltransferase|nr:1-acyl-sn-glycerol-3-phosphate acyltransferase [Treponema sp.]
MKMDTLATAFREEIKKAMALTNVPAVVTGENVYQEGNNDILPILDKMARPLILPGSGVDGMENLEELLAKAESGKACLLLVEHYSNFDLSLVSLLVRLAGGRGDAIAKALIAIAGMKLNEDNPVVAAFASAYTRIVIYPSRSIKGLDEEKKRVELARSNAINRAAMKALEQLKTQGRLVLVFPSGTRYRPWDPSTKKGVREIDSYLRSFDYMCCVALNGEILHVQQTDMLNDVVCRDIIRITAGPVQSCVEFRDRARAAAEAAGNEDKKQAVVDAVMAELERLHIGAEEKRQKLLEEKHD